MFANGFVIFTFKNLKIIHKQGENEHRKNYRTDGYIHREIIADEQSYECADEDNHGCELAVPMCLYHYLLAFYNQHTAEKHYKFLYNERNKHGVEQKVIDGEADRSGDLACAVGWAQTAADTYKSCGGDHAQAAQRLGADLSGKTATMWFGKDWNTCAPTDGAFCLTLTDGDPAAVSITQADGAPLFALEVKAVPYG